MAGRNRVGSLYYEIVLDGSKLKKGGDKAVDDVRRMNKQLADAKKLNDPRKEADERLRIAKEASKRMYKQGQVDLSTARKLRRAAAANHKAEIKSIDNATFESHERQIRSLKEKNDRELADIRKAVREEDRIRDRAIADDKARAKERQAHARRRRTRRLADERAEATRVAAIRRGSFAGGMFGTGTGAMGLGAITQGVGRLTQAMFPLAIAGYAAARMFGVLARAGSAWVKAADEKTKGMLVLTTLLHGNKEAAAELRAELVKYAKATAFSVEGTMQLAVQMKALGFAASEIPSILAKLGRLSFGDTGKLKLIAKAYSDVRAQGKLLMTEVRQFANQGVPLLAQLQMNLGKTALQVRDDMKAGLITFEQVAKAIDDIAESYGNVDEAGLATFSGQMEAAAEAWNEILAKTGESESLLEMARGLNRVLDLTERLVGETRMLDTAVKGVGDSMGIVLDAITSGMYTWVLRYAEIRNWIKGVTSDEQKLKEQMELKVKLQEDLNNIKRESLDLASKEAAATNTMLEQERASENFLKRRVKLKMEIAAASADPAVAAEGEFQLERLEREAALQKEILESQKKIDEERKAIVEAAGNTSIPKEYMDMLDAVAEHDKAEEERLIRAKHAADKAQSERDKAKKDAEDLAKKQEEADKKRRDAAEKLRKQEEEWKRQDIEDARKIIDRAKDAQQKFEKDQSERNKFVDMAPKSSPSFQANSVAEFMFRKEKEIQRETQREENKREQERREHAEGLNEKVVRAIEGLGFNENNNELNFEGIGN